MVVVSDVSLLFQHWIPTPFPSSITIHRFKYPRDRDTEIGRGREPGSDPCVSGRHSSGDLSGCRCLIGPPVPPTYNPKDETPGETRPDRWLGKGWG